jgi:riboflavin kinase
MVDEIMLFLLRSGAHMAPVTLTTTDMGEALGMSQQNVSRRLLLLEKKEMVLRSKGSVTLTEKGISEIKGLLAILQNSFDSKLRMTGVIADGLGEGGFYLSRPRYGKQIKEKFGFKPFPGTLNIKLDAEGVELRRRMLQLEPIIVDGFSENGRTFGDLFSYKAAVEDVECAVVVPTRTHHGKDIIEIVAPMNLRKTLRKKTGDKVAIRIW